MKQIIREEIIENLEAELEKHKRVSSRDRTRLHKFIHYFRRMSDSKVTKVQELEDELSKYIEVFKPLNTTAVGVLIDNNIDLKAQLAKYTDGVVAEFSGTSGECYTKASEVLFHAICHKDPMKPYKVLVIEEKDNE